MRPRARAVSVKESKLPKQVAVLWDDGLLEAGFKGADAIRRASGFINLALGDVYLEAALGLDDSKFAARFCQPTGLRQLSQIPKLDGRRTSPL